MLAQPWTVLGAAGLACLAVGIAGLVTIARRSVSIRILVAIEAGRDPRAAFHTQVAGRVGDLERLGLAAMRDGQLVATRRAWAVRAATRALRRLLGVAG